MSDATLERGAPSMVKQRLTIAEMCFPEFAWRVCEDGNVRRTVAPGGNDLAPDYLNDLNAIHAAVLSRRHEAGFMERYLHELRKLVQRKFNTQLTSAAEVFWMATAEAWECAEAFLRAAHRWSTG